MAARLHRRPSANSKFSQRCFWRRLLMICLACPVLLKPTGVEGATSCGHVSSAGHKTSGLWRTAGLHCYSPLLEGALHLQILQSRQAVQLPTVELRIHLTIDLREALLWALAKAAGHGLRVRAQRSGGLR